MNTTNGHHPNYDNVIVARRCAGAALAIELARAGQRVLLVDRDEFPSDTLSARLPVASPSSAAGCARSTREAAGSSRAQPAGAALARLRARVQRHQSYNDHLEQRMDGTAWTAGSCDSWYLDDTGRNTTYGSATHGPFAPQTREFDADAYKFAP